MSCNYEQHFKKTDDSYENFVQAYFIFQDKPTNENRDNVLNKAGDFKRELRDLITAIKNKIIL